MFSIKQNLLQASLFQPGEFTIQGHKIEVNEACLLMVEFQEGGASVKVSDPTQKLRTVSITVNGKKFMANFPRGVVAGASIIAN